MIFISLDTFIRKFGITNKFRFIVLSGGRDPLTVHMDFTIMWINTCFNCDFGLGVDEAGSKEQCGAEKEKNDGFHCAGRGGSKMNFTQRVVVQNDDEAKRNLSIMSNTAIYRVEKQFQTDLNVFRSQTWDCQQGMT